MRILCCYAENTGRHAPGLYPETREALEQAKRPQDELTFLDVSNVDTAYALSLIESWNGQSDLLVVEHDIVIHPEILDELDACPSDWCAYPYEIATGLCDQGLGCTRFRASLMADCPNVMLRAAECLTDPNYSNKVVDDGVAPWHWVRMDTRVNAVLRQVYDLEPCIHETPVKHLNPSQRSQVIV